MVVLPTIKYAFKPGNIKLKVALGVCYVLFVAELWNAYDNAEAADDNKIPAGGTGWLGHWWLAALFLLFVTITAIHIRFRIDGKRRNLLASK